MHLICVGRRRINLRYLICDEECDDAPESGPAPPGGIVVTLEHGTTFVLTGPDAESYRRQVGPLVMPDPAAGGSAGTGKGTGVGEVAPLPLPPEADGGDEGEGEGEEPAVNGFRPQGG